MHASVLLKENRATHMLIHDPDNVRNLVTSGIYAPAQIREKNEF